VSRNPPLLRVVCPQSRRYNAFSTGVAGAGDVPCPRSATRERRQEYRKYKATFHASTSAGATGAPPAAPALRSQRKPLDGGWPRGLVLGDGQPARLGLIEGLPAAAHAWRSAPATRTKNRTRYSDGRQGYTPGIRSMSGQKFLINPQ